MTLSEAARAFLNEPRFGVLGTINADGSIQQTVMWYLLDGDEILMNTARGRVKAANLETNPRVSLCVEDGYRFVTIGGPVRLTYDQQQTHADIVRIGSKYVDESRIREMYEQQFKPQFRISIHLPIGRAITKGIT